MLTLGLPAKYFTDQKIYEKVRKNIYFKTWQYACHVSQVSRTGDYVSFSVFDQDVFVIRQENGALVALYNVCQHRGHRLLEGTGNRRAIVCPYHAWTYALDGRLRGAPGSQFVPGFDASAICIPQLKVEVFLGFVFVNFDPACLTMDESFPGVRDRLLGLCPDIERQQFATEHSADEACNWLTAVENYNECYHCKVAHPEFAKGVIDPASYRIVPFGSGKVLHHSSQATKSDQAWYDVSGSDYGSFYLWPSTSIQVYPGGVINTYHWRPLTIDCVHVYRGWYSSDGTVDRTLQDIIDLDRETTFAEDLVLVKNVQRGLRSLGYTPGPLIVNPAGSIDNELPIASLHRWLREAVDEGDAEH